MHAPSPPAEDPATAAAQASELARAQADQLTQTQIGLSSDTMAMQRRFGTMSAPFGGAPAGGSGFAGTTPVGGFNLFNGGLNRPQGFGGGVGRVGGVVV